MTRETTRQERPQDKRDHKTGEITRQDKIDHKTRQKTSQIKTIALAYPTRVVVVRVGEDKFKK